MCDQQSLRHCTRPDRSCNAFPVEATMETSQVLTLNVSTPAAIVFGLMLCVYVADIAL